MQLQQLAIGLLFLVSSWSTQNNVQGQVVEESQDKTLSPYFFVKSEDTATDQLPLKSTAADVTINGVIADVRVTQVYKNEGQNTLEAVYVFPASTRAAVYNMIMTIGERTITAKIKEREQARKDYEQARQQGKSASLLEQQRPNVFQMSVANILPGDEIKVELFYTELLVPVDKVYEFVYPTVVGPRYSNKSESQAKSADSWVKNPYLHEGQEPPYDFRLNVILAAGMPIQEITCPSHRVSINYESKNTAQIALPADDKTGGNRDFMLRYRLAGDRIETGLLLFAGAQEKFFLFMLQPPVAVKVNDLPPREYLFILDVSGSMHGFPLDISKKLFKDLVGKLQPTDKFNVLLFAGGSRIFSERSMAATRDNINRAIQEIENEQGGGGTELLPALQRALSLPVDEKYARSILILTDGYVDVEKEAFELVRNNLGRSNFFAFGIGSSVNRFLIEGLARVGMAESFVVTDQNRAEETAEKFRQYVSSPVLSRIKVTFDRFDTYDVEPLSIPDILADRPVIVFGKYRGSAQGRIELTGVGAAGKNYSTSIAVGDYKPDSRYQALKYLWARQRLFLLADYNRLGETEELKNEITQLGLNYNLLTDYTSFIAVDERVRATDGKITRVEQPLPLPQGVSDYAVEGVASKRVGFLPAPSTGVVNYEKSDMGKMSSAGGGSLVDTIKVKLIEIKADVQSEQSKIESFIKSHLSNLKKCYWINIKAIKSAVTTGKVSFRFNLNTNGTIDNVVVLKNDLSANGFESCLVKLVKSWQIINIGGHERIVVECTVEFGNR